MKDPERWRHPRRCYLARVAPARLLALLSLAGFSASCAGASGTAGAEKTGRGEPDRGFAEYAAAHGIRTLNNPHEAEQVTTDGLRLERVDKTKPVKLDGVLSEWPASARATETVKGDSKSTLKIALQYDDAKLYVGADVGDAAFSVGQDHVSLVLAVPLVGGGYASYDVGFFAGNPGETEGTVRYARGGQVAGAKIVEARTSDGYSFEAVVPWAALPEARFTRVGIRGVARYVERDAVVTTGPGDADHPATMPWVPTEPELSLIEQELAPRGLGKTAAVAEVIADLTGDGVRERVAVYEHYLTICGASYLGGTGYFVRDLIGELVTLEARDVTGRGRADVLVRRRQSVGDGTREYLEVLSAMNATEAPRLTFAQEIAVRQSDRHLDNAVRISRGEIEVSVEPPTGWDAATYKEPIASEVEPILFPWGRIRQRTFRFDGSRFIKAREVTQKELAATRGHADDEAAPAREPEDPATPKVARGAGLSTELLEQYRRDRGVGRDVPAKVDLQVNVAGDAQPEHVVLIGRDIVVFGPGFKGGTGYAYLTLQPFADARDIKDMSARDLTGDGAAELIVRGVRHLSTEGARRDKRGSVDVDLLFVYGVTNDALTRFFAIETARQRSGKRVQGLVQFIPAEGGKTFDILSAPGRASGWTASSYPWPQDRPGSGSVEPLLLPWGGVRSARYTWNGSEFVRSGG